MKQSITKSVLMAFMLLASVTASAYDAEIDSIFYDFKGDCAIVTKGTNATQSYSGDMVLPSSVTYNGRVYTVSAISEHAFDGCTELTSIVIPNTVTSIGKYAFRGCSKLASFNFPEQMTSISNHCFAECDSLKSLVIPEGITEIEACAFIKCANLASITFPQSLIKIGSIAFDETAWFNNQPNGLVYIGTIAYKYHGQIPRDCEIVIREGTTCISGQCFWEWSTTGLKSVTIPSSVRFIGYGAFYHCGNLTSITLPEGIEEIEDIAFCHCSKLTTITIPASVKSLGERICDDCQALAEIIVEPDNTVYDSRDNCNAIIRTADNVLIEGCLNSVIPQGVEAIGRRAFDSTYLPEATMPASVKPIGEYAFQRCDKLTSVDMPGVTTVERYAFRWCTSLITVSIGSSIQSIGAGAFAGCSEMTDVYCYATQVPRAASDAFQTATLSEQTVLHVPYELLEQYRTTLPWSEFKEIVPLALPQCEAPTITLLPDGRVKVESATEGATCVTNVTACNEEPLTGSEIGLNESLVLYTVTSYATAEGYEDSEVTTATFRWNGSNNDVNGDGQVNVADVTALIGIILNH